MKKISLYVACLFVLSMLVVPCSALAFFGVDVGVGYWQQNPSGSFSYKSSAPADQLDLENDLHFNGQNKPFVRAKVELPLILPNIYFMATPMKFDGSGPISRTINFGGETFTANVPIDSTLKLDHYDLALYYPIPLLKTATVGILNIELGLDVRMFNFEGTLTQSNQTVSDKLTLYVPMLYAGIIVKPISFFSIEVEARASAYGSNHYYDYIGRLRINPIPLVFIGGGYRAEEIKVEQSDVLADIKFKGPFVEAGFHF